MRKAAAPITGGMIWPPVEDTASTPPAVSAVYPAFFMFGMVMMPVDMTFATALPEMVPKSAEATTSTLPVPPRKRPNSALEMSVKKSAPPHVCSRRPKNMNASTVVEAMMSAWPSRLEVSSAR